jgi:hypothetical protein
MAYIHHLLSFYVLYVLPSRASLDGVMASLRFWTFFSFDLPDHS